MKHKKAGEPLKACATSSLLPQRKGAMLHERGTTGRVREFIHETSSKEDTRVTALSSFRFAVSLQPTAKPTWYIAAVEPTYAW
jgi:hypothetical protein